MKKEVVKFSRLLQIVEMEDSSKGYVIELEENGKKELYCSYFEEDRHIFERAEFAGFPFDLNNLSDECLMASCEDASYMFCYSPITHFEADCPLLRSAFSMFEGSQLRVVNGTFPLLKHADSMFLKTVIKEFNADLPNLINGSHMFAVTPLKRFSGNLDSLLYAESMFSETKIESFDSKTPKIINTEDMFFLASEDFKKKHPYYFV